MLKDDLKDYNKLEKIAISKAKEILDKIKAIVNYVFNEYHLNCHFRIDLYPNNLDFDIKIFKDKLPKKVIETIKEYLNAKDYETFIENKSLILNYKF